MFKVKKLDSVKKRLFIIAVSCFLLLGLSSNVFAADDISSKATISGKHEITNNHSLGNVNITFVLTAGDTSQPMPLGSENGVKKVSSPAGQPFSFGEINFTQRGQYSYKVSREPLNSPNLTEDMTVYDVIIEVQNDGVLTVIYKKSDSDAKLDELIYKDVYVESPDNPTKPNEPTTIIEKPTKPDNPTSRAKTSASSKSSGSDYDDEDSDRSTSKSNNKKSNFQTGDFLPYVLGGLLVIVLGLVGLLIYKRRKE